jgi:hypothetical protein
MGREGAAVESVGPLNSAHIHGTSVPVEEPVHSTKSGCEQSQQAGTSTRSPRRRVMDRVGHLDDECPGRLQIAGELEFVRLQDRQVGGLGALEDVAGINSDMMPRIRKIGAIAHQQARPSHG